MTRFLFRWPMTFSPVANGSGDVRGVNRAIFGIFSYSYNEFFCLLRKFHVKHRLKSSLTGFNGDF